MGKYFSVVLFGLIYSSCTTFFPHNPWEDVPKYTDIQGLYRSTCSPDQDSLIIAGQTDGVFFLLTKDSLGKELLIRGVWSYIPESEYSDYGLYIPGYGELFLSETGGEHARSWWCGVHFQENGKKKGIVLIDTLHRNTFKKTSPPELNSRGKPFSFIKIITINSLSK